MNAPARVGPYRIVGMVGEGGMGVVYRGEHEQTGERVAVKTVRVPQEADLAGIRREIHALSRIHHPGVVRIAAEGVERGLPWYAMELLEGRTLQSHFQSIWRTSPRGTGDLSTQIATAAGRSGSVLGTGTSTAPLEDEDAPARVITGDRSQSPAAGGRLVEALTLMRKLCETLAFLHGEGIVHRDLKPSNVFLRGGRDPVLVDFGLVLRVEGARGREVLDISASGMGTPDYMAPELIRGGLMDARTDLYALGCILYEAITGEPPFSGTTLHEVLRKHLVARPEPPSRRVVGVPEALDVLTARLLEKRPRDRLGHADDVAQALGALGAEPRPASQRRRARAYVYRPEIVGRDEILAGLAGHLERLGAGKGACVLLGGESGIGKTHLAMAFARTATARKVVVVSGVCVAAGAAPAEQQGGPRAALPQGPGHAPLHPFTPVLQTIADRCIELGSGVMGSILGERAKVLAAVEPSLARLPGQDHIPDPPELPARAARERLLRTLADTLAAFARWWPLLVILDDLQWADELSLDFLTSLPAGYFDGIPLLLVGTYRSEEQGEGLRRLLDRPDVQRVALGRLDERSVGAMVGDMLALTSPPPPFIRFLAERSVGNPFFVAEYVRTAVAEGLLHRTPAGRWEVAADERDAAAFERLPLPGSLRDLVAQRLGRLGDAARALAEVASVIGSDVDAELLAGVSDLGEYAAMEALRELIARQVLEEVAGGRLRFLHDKLREIAYERAPLARRRELHGRVGRALEARAGGPADLAPLHARLAHHFTQADDAPRAVTYLERAAEQALGRFANREAIALFGDLVALYGRSEATRAERESDRGRVRRARWERQIAEAYYGLGDLDATSRHVTSALVWAGEAPPRSTRGWAASLLWNIPVQIAHRLAPDAFVAPEERRELLREAAASMQRLSERFYFLDAVGMVAGSLWSVNLAERAGGDVRVAMPYGMLGLTAQVSRLGGLSRRYFALAHAAAAETHDLRGLVHTLFIEATARSGEGDFPAARELLGRALEAAVRMGDRSETETVETIVANADYFQGRFAESKRFFLGLARASRTSENAQHLAWGLYGAARAMIPLGEIDQALPLLEEARAVLEPQVELPSKIITLGLLATVHLRRGDLAGAVALANLTTAKIRENMLAAYAIVTGYASAAEVYLALWEAASPAETPAARRVAAQAIQSLHTISVSLPIGRPLYHRWKGREQLLAGRRRRARSEWEQGLAAAIALGMPHDQALAHRDLASLEPAGSAARRQHLGRARALFAGMGCAPDLAAVQAEHP